jgi:nucleoporin NUP159
VPDTRDRRPVLPCRLSTFGVASPLSGAPGCDTKVVGAPASACGDPAFGDPVFGDPAFADPVFGDPAFGDPAFGDPAFGDPAFGDRAFPTTAGGGSGYPPPPLPRSRYGTGRSGRLIGANTHGGVFSPSSTAAGLSTTAVVSVMAIATAESRAPAGGRGGPEAATESAAKRRRLSCSAHPLHARRWALISAASRTERALSMRADSSRTLE